MSAALLAGVLVAGGVYLLAQRGLVRVVLGFVLLGHAANIVLLAAGGLDRRGAPIADGSPSASMADPLPQAFVLTAIVITFAVTVYLFTLALRGGPSAAGGTDEPTAADGGSAAGDDEEDQPPAGGEAADGAPTADPAPPVAIEAAAPRGSRR